MARALACWVVALLALQTSWAQAQPDLQRGRALYHGDLPLHVLVADKRVQALPQAACVKCHRPSGLGSFEGSLAAPPIAGRLLFKPYDPDTGGFFGEQRRYRLRPAYDPASLHHLLTTGTAPDGYQTRAPMPRYDMSLRDVADLAAYLATLARGDAPGLDAQGLWLAAVFTPDVPEASRDAMFSVLQRFVQAKNAQTRHDPQRSAQTARSHEMAMNRKYRRWHLDAWQLQGPPPTWAAQLADFHRRQPVFALVAGMGADEWAPVHRFCEAERLPCLLPWLQQAPANLSERDFYSLYFHPGLSMDLSLALDALQKAGWSSVRVWSPQAAPPLVWQILLARGLRPAKDDTEPAAVLSLLPPQQHLARLAALSGKPPGYVAWLPGPQAVSPEEWAQAAAPLAQGVLVTPLRLATDARRPTWPRAQAWLRQQGLQSVPLELGAAALQAMTTLGEALAHIDFDFTREYALELLEHGLESMVSYGPYDRLAIAPGQRIGAKGSHVALVVGGALSPWQWQVAPAAAGDQNRSITSTVPSAAPLR